MRESDYQAGLIKRLKRIFPGCYVLKNDTDYLQGVPDLLVLYRDKWAALEVKPKATAPVQPNQEYYICEMDDLSFAAFIYPENEEAVLHALQQTFGSGRSTRVS